MISEDSEFDTLMALLEYIVDSCEKLDVLVLLYRIRPMPLTAVAITRSLQLSPEAVADVLASLQQAGIMRTHQQSEGGWWFDPAGVWAGNVDVLVDLHDIDRSALLSLMTHIAFRSFQSSDPCDSILAFARRRSRGPQLPN